VIGIHAPGDISAALSASVENGGLLLDEKHLSAGFFDLRTGLAGEVLQKFTNYRAKLAIVVADSAAYGSRFGELIHEHRTHRSVRFFSSEQLARQWLAYNPVAKC
jgi:PadR family transcriptional regulator, regulatory protein AphA